MILSDLRVRRLRHAVHSAGIGVLPELASADPTIQEHLFLVIPLGNKKAPIHSRAGGPTVFMRPPHPSLAV